MSESHFSAAAYYRLVRRNPNFRRLWVAQIISELGDWFYSVAIYDLVLRLTGSAQWVGLAVLLQVLPMFLLGPTAGAVNDRVSRRASMIVADLVRAAIVLAMIVVQTREQIWLLYVLLGLEVATASFFEPARNAVIANIVEESEVIGANALSSATWSFNLAVGAGVGGLVVHAMGRDAAFVINSLSFLASAALILRMRFEEPHLEGHRDVKWIDILGLGPIVEGIRYVRGDARLASTLFVKCGLGFLGANLVLLPLIGEREFHAGGAGVLGMSTLFMFRGVGAIIGPLVAGRWAGSDQARLRRGVLFGFVMAGVCYLLFSRAPSLAVAAACVAGAHTGGSIVWVFSTTLLQINTEDRFRGRIFAADFGLLTLSISVSATAAGVAMDHGAGPRVVAAALGCVMFVPAGLWWAAQRQWRVGRLP
jgi:predicted MFS family arabinose efflux permease